MRFPGEREDLERAVNIGRKWGYGNVISQLKRAWAIDLVEKYGISVDAAVRAADVGLARATDVAKAVRNTPAEGEEE